MACASALQTLASHNQDIQRLLEKGYALAVDNGYLVIRDIPYLDGQRALHRGAIVTKLVFTTEDKVIQENHQVFFAGSSPCQVDGARIPYMGDRPAVLTLSNACADVKVERSFSNKPNGGDKKFPDFFEKVESYMAIICGPAMTAYDVTPYTFRSVDKIAEDSVFYFHDTLTARAEIGDLAQRLGSDVVAIIGLGGTGSYVADFMAKSPIAELRLFDPDAFYVHNAFRSPGRLERKELDKKKVSVYEERYREFRRGVKGYPVKVYSDTAEGFEGVTFAFVCVDDGPARAGIVELLTRLGIAFIDVGMGLRRKNQGPIGGMLRTTYYSAEKTPERHAKNLAPLTEAVDREYRAQIQIGELNALNAALAVLKYKQVRGFYAQESGEIYHSLFDIIDLRCENLAELDASVSSAL